MNALRKTSTERQSRSASITSRSAGTPVRYAPMAVPQRNVTLRLRPASIALAVVLLGLAIGGLALLAASTRVIGWILTAATLAGLLHPVVERLRWYLPRALALATVVFVSLGVVAGIGYAVVDELNAQLHELEEAVPRAAREVEESERFGEAATEIHLAERAEAFVDELPSRLRGGEVQDAIRSAATRGVAFLATGVLTIFFLIHGPRLLMAASKQVGGVRSRRVRRVGFEAYRRSWRYIAGSLGMAGIAGLLSYACASAIDVPGAAPLGVWMALLDFVPVLGVVLGALPLVLLAAATTPWWQTALVGAVLVGGQLVEVLYLQKRVERASLHIGPFVTIAVAMVGLELYGIGGALVALVATVVLAATLDEVVGSASE
jgi:predicted PurR-regulated permease PerM